MGVYSQTPLKREKKSRLGLVLLLIGVGLLIGIGIALVLSLSTGDQAPSEATEEAPEKRPKPSLPAEEKHKVRA